MPTSGSGSGRVSSLPPAAAIRLILTVAVSTARQRIRTTGLFFYLLVWVTPSLFSTLTVVFIYRAAPELREYAVVGGAGLALLFAMQFNAGQILDEERYRGTLGNLFISPGPRYVWLAGFQLYAVAESLVAAAVVVSISATAFGVAVSVDVVSLAVTLLLLFLCMWGFSMVVGAIGLALRDANQLSNLLFPVTMLLSGTMYPIALLPGWVELPARALPFGYAMQALADAVLGHATLTQVADQLVPLAGFAVALPVLGVAAFHAVERQVRRRGALELV